MIIIIIVIVINASYAFMNARHANKAEENVMNYNMKVSQFINQNQNN